VIAPEGAVLSSSVAVFGSYLLSIVLVLISDLVLALVYPGDFVRDRVPSTPPLIASTALFVIVSIFCAGMCARFAPSRPGRHVLAFFALGEFLGAVVASANWNSGWPHWYAVAWLLIWPLACWVGLRQGAPAKRQRWRGRAA
jgi:hypothetical protein